MQAHSSAILEGEAGFKVLFEYATISIIVVDREGRIGLANPCAKGTTFIIELPHHA